MKSTKQISMWFPTLIYEDILSEILPHNNHLLSKAYNIQSQSPDTKVDWNCDTYNTMLQYDLVSDNDPVIQQLLQVSKEKVIDFANEFGVKKTVSDLECNDYWFNIAKPGSYQEYHIHPKSDFSLIYYVKTPDNCGNVRFQSSSSLFDSFPLPVNELTYASYRDCFYTPKESLILIFRSNLGHMVEKNLSNEDRISIAMNFKFKEG